MIALVAQQDPTSWPDVVLSAIICAAFCFVMWLVSRL